MNNPAIRTALISVSDKRGLLPFAQQLAAHGIKILATGGTAALLKQHQIPLIPISDYTGFPEMMGGRVKTLHPKIYAGLLRRSGIDETVLAEHQIDPIDLVVVNLYPFQKTIAQPGCTFEQAIEQIDIGGPAMVRAAAKNHSAVTVLVDPNDYEGIWAQIQQNGHVDPQTRRQLAQKAFAHTAAYDQAIYQYLEHHEAGVPSSTVFPPVYQPVYQKQADLRYGENPHQAAAVYRETPAAPNTLAAAPLLQGKPLSFNNLLDSDAALNCARALDAAQPGCAIIKHATPCGVAQAATLTQAYRQALMTDPTSAFGGIIAMNRPIDPDTAAALLQQALIEVIIAPGIDPQALQMLHAKPSWRVLCFTDTATRTPSWALRSINGGLLVQEEDQENADTSSFTVVTQRQPTAAQQRDLAFAWRVVKFVKSNAIVYAQNQTTLGIGGGQTSRVFSAQIAALKAQQNHLSLDGAVAASDAFFPFTDGLAVIAEAGIRAVIQPGGSKRDAEVIQAADRYGIAMVFTHTRHFRH
jgi:phosphoribosylaminoimidazolecarboxamide formyltransferase / IMP cyclohydrolase